MSVRSLPSEGDVNNTTLRTAWQHAEISEATRVLLDRDSAVFLHQALSTPCLNVLEHSSGSVLTDVSGKTLLDFHGNYVHNIGFGHPAVQKAVLHQMESLSFCTRRYTNLPAIELAERLTGYTQTLKRVLFAPGGAEAVGIALKIARLATGRHKTISLWDSFHGASLDTASIGGEAEFRKDIGPLLPGTEHAPPSNPSECPFECGKVCNLRCAGYIEYMLEKEGDIAAVIAETVRSSPYIPPPDYWKRIRAACDRHGALLILDEIPHALGRTGRMFTFQHYDIEPDMVVIGKGLGGGIFPLAAVLCRDNLNQSVKDHSIGHYTHEKNPVSCAAALAMLDVVEQENLLLHVQKMNVHAMNRMNELKEMFPIVHDVRGLGLLLGIELRNPNTGEKARQEAETVMYYCLSNGLNFKLSMGCIINLIPPLTVTTDELDQAFDCIENGLKTLP